MDSHSLSALRHRSAKIGRLFFFFSSRRRHTRFDCDWSSDVCSSDLFLLRQGPNTFLRVEFWTVGRKVFDVEAWVSRAEFLDRLPLMGGGVIQKHDEGTTELP